MKLNPEGDLYDRSSGDKGEGRRVETNRNGRRMGLFIERVGDGGG